MKKILSGSTRIRLISVTAAVAGICLTLPKLKPIRAYAWFSDTHKNITADALKLLEKEKKQKAAAFYKSYREQLLKGSTDPDEPGDIDKGSGTHYYSYANPKGKLFPQSEGYYQNRLGEYSKSARTMLEENYTCALCLYKNNKIPEAMYALGRAIHFLEDISCPVHTAGLKYQDKPKNTHYAFEKHANTISGKFSADSFDKRLLKAFSSDSFEAASNRLSQQANRHAPLIATLDPIAFSNAAEEMAVAGSQNVMALLNKFYEDCANGKGKYLTDGKPHIFRNEATGELITVGKKGSISLENSSKDKEQRLTLVISDEGTFALKAADGSFVNAAFKSTENPKDEAKAAKFRFAALGKNTYRISTEATQYAKVLTAKSGSVTTADFRPGDKTQIWTVRA